MTMRYGRILIVAAVMVVWAGPDALAQEEAPQERKPGVAVFPFQNGGSYGEEADSLEPLTVGLQQMLLTELDQNEELRIVERSMLKQIMEEQNLGQSGRIDSKTAAKVGKLVGAQYMVTGVFVDLYGKFRMDARIIDVETSEVVQTESVRGNKEKLYALLVDLSTEITEGADLPLLPTSVQEKRKRRDIPPEAVTTFSRAQVYQDRGRTKRAAKLYRQLLDQYPDLTQAETALQQLTSS